MELLFTKLAETKGTWRYEQIQSSEDKKAGKRPEVGQLYLTKDAVKELGSPTAFKMVITPINDTQELG